MSAALLRPAPPPQGIAATLAVLRSLLPEIAARGAALDRDGAFPEEDVAALRGIGLLAAPLPAGFGGHGLGTGPEGAAAPACRSGGSTRGT